MNPSTRPAPRRPRSDFIKFTGITATGSTVNSLRAPATAAAPKIALGLDAHSVRGMGWKARQHIDYAAEQKLDAVLFNTLRPLELLAPHVLCTSVRDWMVWKSPEGATFQWTALGDGLMDVPAFLGLMQRHCPAAPLILADDLG